jgi:hypothetical protein
MPSFMTRIELHDGSYDEYQILHQAMAAEGFERTITSDDGVTYHLPSAEYYRTVELTRQQVLEAAKRAAGKTRKSFAAIVTESRGSTWNGLKKA